MATKATAEKERPLTVVSGKTGEEIEAAEGRPEMTLAERLLRITQEMGEVRRSGENKEFKYTYATEEDILAQARPLEAKYGVLVLPSVIEREQRDNGRRTKAGVPVLTTALHLRVRFINVDRPEEVYEIDWWGEAEDHSDKATYQAYTGGLRTLRQKVYAVATADDPEREKGFETRGRRQGNGGAAQGPKPASQAQINYARNLMKSHHVGQAYVARLEKILGVEGPPPGFVDGKKLSQAIDTMKKKIEAGKAAEEEGQIEGPTEEQRRAYDDEGDWPGPEEDYDDDLPF